MWLRKQNEAWKRVAEQYHAYVHNQPPTSNHDTINTRLCMAVRAYDALAASEQASNPDATTTGKQTEESP